MLVLFKIFSIKYEDLYFMIIKKKVRNLLNCFENIIKVLNLNIFQDMNYLNFCIFNIQMFIVIFLRNIFKKMI